MCKKIDQALETFLSFRPENTRRAYKFVFELWRDFSCGKIKDPDPSIIVAWLGFMKQYKQANGEPLTNSTIQDYYKRLQSIYNYLSDIEITKSPFTKVRRLISWRQQQQKRPTKFIPSSVVKKSFAVAGEGLDPIRDRAMLSLFFGGGLRISEVTNLKLDHIDCIYRNIIIKLYQPKAGHYQEQPLPLWASNYVRDFLEIRKDQARDGRESFLVQYFPTSKRLRPMSYSTIFRRFKEIISQAGLICSPHSARATAVTMLIKQGYRDREAAQFLRVNHVKVVKMYDKRAFSWRENPGLKLKY